MARLHQRGIDLLLNLHSALDYSDQMSMEETRELLQEAEVVLRDLLARDIPQQSASETDGTAPD